MTDDEFDADVRAAAEAMYGSRSGKSAFLRVVAEAMRLRGRSVAVVQQGLDEAEKASPAFEHAFYQDREPREPGKCDYTYPDGDWCGRPQAEHVSVADLNAALESACAQLRDAPTARALSANCNDGLNELARDLARPKATRSRALASTPPAYVTVGQVWEPCDKRCGPKNRERRRFKIVAIEGGVQAVVENLLRGRPDRQGRRRTIRRRILIARMRPGASGYRPIS